mgnify:CR=1 FL=1|jgi:hypothetical protein
MKTRKKNQYIVQWKQNGKYEDVSMAIQEGSKEYAKGHLEYLLDYWKGKNEKFRIIKRTITTKTEEEIVK